MMMKKSWKNRSGVSPVIATILMVAITVVLAAVLYVMVMGFGNNQSTTPTISLKQTSEGNKTYNVTVISVSGNPVKVGNIQVIVSGTAGGISSGVLASMSTGTDPNVAAADYVKITTTQSGTVNVVLKDTVSGNQVGSLSFNV